MFVFHSGRFFALGNRTAGRFIVDRVQRLLVPLLVGVCTHVAFQVYLERLSHRQFYDSFWAFLPHYFDGAAAIHASAPRDTRCYSRSMV